MSGKTKILALLLLGLGLIFLVMAFLSGQNVQKGKEVVKTEIERFPVVVTGQEISFGTVITPDMVKVERFAIAPAGAFTDIGDVIGKKPQFTIGKGLPVTTIYFQSGAVAAEVRDGFRAFALRLDENNVATAQIKAGDFVDVFSIFRANNREIQDTVSRMIMPNLRVLSVGTQLVNAPESATTDPENRDNNRAARLRAMMVEVPTAEISALAMAQSQGELFVVIRNPEDDELPDPSKFPKADPALMPLKPTTKPGQAASEVELTASDRAFAGVTLSNTLLPGSGNSTAPNRPANTAPAQRRAPVEPTIEVIRGGETSRETAR